MKRTLTRLPRVELAPAEAAKKLRDKYAEQKAQSARDAFWKAVQESKQPAVSDDFFGPIG